MRSDLPPATLFSTAERDRIAKAIAAAEAETSGEIVAVVTRASDGYHFVGLLWAAVAALLVPLPLIFATAWPVQYIYLIQVLAFIGGALLMQRDAVRLALVPQAIKRARSHRRAVEQFLAQNLHTTKGRTGVLIFVSAAERFAEVIADDGIYKKVPATIWDDLIASLTQAIARGRAADGFVQAIEHCGGLLAEHFPRGSHDHDELPNHLIEL